MTRHGIYQNEYIDHWGVIFTSLDIYNKYGVNFSVFLLNPSIMMDRLGSKGGPHLPLLKKQLEVHKRILSDDMQSTDSAEIQEFQEFESQRLRCEKPNVVFRNGGFFERMLHKAHPRRKPRRFKVAV